MTLADPVPEMSLAPDVAPNGDVVVGVHRRLQLSKRLFPVTETKHLNTFERVYAFGTGQGDHIA